MKSTTLAISFLSLLFIMSSCNETEVIQDKNEEEILKEEVQEDPYLDRYGEHVDYQPFQISFRISEKDENLFSFEVITDVTEGSFYLSPYAGTEFGGRFKIRLEENEHLMISGLPSESPSPGEEFYYWGDKEVKKVTEKTTYHQTLVLQSKDDFEVSGTVSFTVEPNCNFYESLFKLKYTDGEMIVEQGETRQNNDAFVAG